MQFTVFYSWQSDLPKETNQGVIKGAIGIASNKLENEFKEIDLRITLDEATRDLPGSPHIPSAIFDKIASADAFICDITTINKEVIEAIKNLQATEGRKKPQEVRTVPNPNVMIELGYAIALLGWERIIMLFNTSYGDLKDAPFDIVVNRITDYNSSPKAEYFTEKQLQGNQKQLSQKIHEALKLIIEKSPNKPKYKAELTPEEIKRKRDISTIQTILETIHITSIKNHINEVLHILTLTFQTNNHKPLNPFPDFQVDAINHHQPLKYQKQIDNFPVHNDDKKHQYNLLNHLPNPNFPANHLLYHQHKDEYNQHHDFAYLAATAVMLPDISNLSQNWTDYKSLHL